MKISLFQMHVSQTDISDNLSKIERTVEKLNQDTDVIVFPEYCVQGSISEHPERADTNSEYRNFFSNLANENDIDIVSCFVEENNNEKYNTAYYFSESGEILGSYRKNCLWHSEKDVLEPGKKTETFDTQFGRTGFGICWDLAYPQVFREQKNADIIYVPSFWSDAGISNHPIESMNIDNLCYSRAFENNCIIVYCNAAQKYKPNDNLIGHSQVSQPIKGSEKLDHNSEGILTVNIDKEYLERANDIYRL